MRLCLSVLLWGAGHAVGECNGTVRLDVDCVVRVYVGPCPALACPDYAQPVEGSACLHIDRGFHMVMLQAACTDVAAMTPVSITDCVDVDDLGMGQYFQTYSSSGGVILSTVLKGSWDPLLNHTNAPPTSNDCGRILPIRAGFLLELDYASSSTQVFGTPTASYAVRSAAVPPPPPNFLYLAPPPPASPPSVPMWGVAAICIGTVGAAAILVAVCFRQVCPARPGAA